MMERLLRARSVMRWCLPRFVVAVVLLGAPGCDTAASGVPGAQSPVAAPTSGPARSVVSSGSSSGSSSFQVGDDAGSAERSAPGRTTPSPADQRGPALTTLSCGELSQRYNQDSANARAYSVDGDCSMLLETSLMCPGCQSYYNPHTPAVSTMRAIAQAFRRNKCSLAPCTPPRCEHLSATCVKGYCVTRQS